MTSLSILDFLNIPQTPQQVRSCVSASKLNLWLKCPLAFRRRYIDGVPSSMTPSLFFGKVVHDVLDGIYRCAMLQSYATEDDIPGFVDVAWNRAMNSEPCDFEDETKELKSKNLVVDIVRAYLSEIDIVSEKPIAVEEKYNVPLLNPLTGEDFGITLIGITDLILEGASGPVIVDFKTAASASMNCELQHELQLTAYSYLIRHVFGRKESSLQIRQLVKTKTPKIVTHCYPARSDEHFSRFFGIVREYLESLDRGVFNFRPSWNCSMCEHSGSCVSFLSTSSNNKESKECHSPSFVFGG